MKEELILIGAGGLAREVMEMTRLLNGISVVGILDDNEALVGRSISGAPVLGKICDLAKFPKSRVLICVANSKNPRRRLEIADQLNIDPNRYFSAIHPTVSLGSSVRIGHGAIIMSFCSVTADVAIGQHCVVMPNVVMTHDDMIGNGCTFGAGSTIAGNVKLGDSVYVGSGSHVREFLQVGSGAVLGMGSVVTKDVPPDEVWIGNPAQRLSINRALS